MKLTADQQKIVEKNMGLVGKVIKDKVHKNGCEGIFTYEDLFQIGCIGLCKAAATDKGGCFSTYAYRLIWNEICDYLIHATKISSREYALDISEMQYTANNRVPLDDIDTCEKKILLEQIKRRTTGVVAKGIICLELSTNGYTSQEIGKLFGAEAPTVRMWMTKARCYLKEQPELLALAKETEE